MKAAKIIAAVVISIFLLLAEGVLFGLFAIDKALSEESIRESVAATDMIPQMVDEALSESTVNMGGQYGELVKQIMKTDAMTDFFTQYMIQAINAEVYGTAYEEVANDELMTAFSQGIEEVKNRGTTISSMEEELLKQVMLQEIPDLTAGLNSAVSSYEAAQGAITQESLEQDDELQTALGTGVRIVIICICLALCAALIALFRQSKLGFVWCAAVTGIVALVFGFLTLTDGAALLGAAQSSSDQLLLRMIGNGFGAVTIAAFSITAIFIILCIIFRTIGRKKTA
ncbi:MAG: hypothetical protein Q4C25_02875 [Bacillota bacterium]|nr:hypothetical protein [Bacillota bacterium]